MAKGGFPAIPVMSTTKALTVHCAGFIRGWSSGLVAGGRGDYGQNQGRGLPAAACLAGLRVFCFVFMFAVFIP